MSLLDAFIRQIEEIATTSAPDHRAHLWRQITKPGVATAALSESNPDPAIWDRAGAAAGACAEKIPLILAFLLWKVDGERLKKNLLGLISAGRLAHTGVGETSYLHWANLFRLPGDTKARTVHKLEIPVALVGGNHQGRIATVYLRKYGPEFGAHGLHEHPDAALYPLGSRFLEAIQHAWPGGMLTDWQLSETRADIDGASIGGAIRTGFACLLADLPYDPQCLILATWEFQWVREEQAKIEAAMQAGIRYVAVGSDSSLNQFKRLNAIEDAIQFVTADLLKVNLPCPGGPGQYQPTSVSKSVLSALVTGKPVLFVIIGPSGFGKTSLCNQIPGVVGHDVKVISLNLPRPAADEKEYLLTFCYNLANAAGVPPPDRREWDTPLGPDAACTDFVETMLDSTSSRVVLVLEKSDRLFGSHLEGLYSMFRNWQESTAHGGPWQRFSFLLTTQRDPGDFVRPENFSPFNAGLRIRLTPFSPSESVQFLTRWGGSLADDQARHALAEFTGGLPRLLTIGAQAINRRDNPLTVDTLIATALDWNSPFADHLGDIERQITDPLRVAIAALRLGSSIPAESARELIRFGIILRTPNGLKYSSSLYERFFQAKFNQGKAGVP